MAHYKVFIGRKVGDSIADKWIAGRISNDGGPHTASGQISDFGPVSLMPPDGGVHVTQRATETTWKDPWLGL